MRWLRSVIYWFCWLCIFAFELCLRFNCDWAFIGPMTLDLAMEIAKWCFFPSAPLFSSAFLVAVFAIVSVFAVGPVIMAGPVFAARSIFAARSVFAVISAALVLVVPGFT